MKTDSLLTQTKKMLRRYDLKARKRLGQHFLIDDEVLRLIIFAAEIAPTDIILEVGPGLGILTRELAGKAGRVIAIELDDKLAALLEQTLSSFHNVTIINENILHIDLPALLPEPKSSLPGAEVHYKVVANLPYYITSPVLHHFLQASVKPQTIIVMVQKEVAEAIVAEPGQRSVLSNMVQLYGKPKIVSYVPAQSFYPAPEVDSAILRIDVYPRPVVAITDEKGFFELIRAGFTARRKQIANSLAQGLGFHKNTALELLGKAGINPHRRAETLTLEEWAQLWEVFTREKGEN